MRYKNNKSNTFNMIILFGMFKKHFKILDFLFKISESYLIKNSAGLFIRYI